MEISTVDDWQTSSDVWTLESDEARSIFIDSSPSLTPPPPRRQIQKLSSGMSFLKKECHSTAARTAVNPYQRKRQPNAQNKLKHYYFHSNSKLQLSYIVIIIVHFYGCVTNSYP